MMVCNKWHLKPLDNQSLKDLKSSSKHSPYAEHNHFTFKVGTMQPKQDTTPKPKPIVNNFFNVFQ